MAQVDFSNAVLDVDANNSYYPMTQNNYLGIAFSPYLSDENNQIIGGSSMRVITNTPSKVSILFAGAFTASGTEFWLSRTTYNSPIFKVSNVSFSNNDTYSFVIDIEVSGNS